jgi:hypothetical protein
MLNMEPKTVREKIKNGKAKSIGRNTDVIVEPEYIVKVEGGDIIYGSNFIVTGEEFDEILYNMYGKIPSEDLEYYEQKDLRIIVWTLKDSDLIKRKLKYDTSEELWEEIDKTKI